MTWEEITKNVGKKVKFKNLPDDSRKASGEGVLYEESNNYFLLQNILCGQAPKNFPKDMKYNQSWILISRLSYPGIELIEQKSESEFDYLN